MTFYSGKVRWGETILETAERETEEETGLIVPAKDWEHRGIYHEIVRHKNTGEVVEDKIFHIVYTDKFSGEMMVDFEGGKNFWLDLDDVRRDPKHFHSFEIEARAAERNIGFVEQIDEYGGEDF